VYFELFSMFICNKDRFVFETKHQDERDQ